MWLAVLYAAMIIAGDYLSAQWLIVVGDLAVSPSVAIVAPAMITRHVLLARFRWYGMFASIALYAASMLVVAWWFDSAQVIRVVDARVVALFLGELIADAVWGMTPHKPNDERLLLAHVAFVLVVSTTFAVGFYGVIESVIVGRALFALVFALAAWIAIVRVEHAAQRVEQYPARRATDP